MDREEFYSHTMDEYDSSFNIAIGIDAKDFDWFDNEFLTAEVFELENDSHLIPREDITLKTCHP